jgi:hypothetical protein
MLGVSNMLIITWKQNVSTVTCDIFDNRNLHVLQTRVLVLRSVLKDHTSQNTSEHETTRVNTSQKFMNTSQKFMNTSEHESKICEHEWTRVKNWRTWVNTSQKWRTRVNTSQKSVNTSQKRILKEAPCSFNLSPWWRSVLCNCTRDSHFSQDSWRPTGCWINNNNYYYNENFIQF